MQIGLRVITLQEANKEKCYRNIGKMNDWMAPLYFRILFVAIIFSPCIQNDSWIYIRSILTDSLSKVFSR